MDLSLLQLFWPLQSGAVSSVSIPALPFLPSQHCTWWLEGERIKILKKKMGLLSILRTLIS